MRIDPRSRSRDASRRPSDGRSESRASSTMTSTAPISAASTSTCRPEFPGSMKAIRSASRFASRTATGARSFSPTTTTHDPDWDAAVLSCSASEVAPTPPIVMVEPRMSPPSGTSRSRGSTTGTTAWRAKTTGRMRSASSCNEGGATEEGRAAGRTTPPVSNRCSMKATG